MPTSGRELPVRLDKVRLGSGKVGVNLAQHVAERRELGVVE
jgi:hypothetical protein